MMRVRVISAVVMALALAAGSVAIVHAGGGGQGIGDTFMFDCYLIDGFSPPHILTINDQFFPLPNPEVEGSPTSVGRV